jgi:hypothetical protein
MPKVTIVYEKADVGALSPLWNIVTTGHVYGVLDDGENLHKFEFGNNLFTEETNKLSASQRFIEDACNNITLFFVGPTIGLGAMKICDIGNDVLNTGVGVVAMILAMRTVAPYLGRYVRTSKDSNHFDDVPDENKISFEISHEQYCALSQKIDEVELAPTFYFTAGRNCVTQLNKLMREIGIEDSKSFLKTPKRYVEGLRQTNGFL